MKKLLLLVLLSLAVSSYAAAVTLTNVTTNVTADGKLEIIYDLNSCDPENTLPVFTAKFSSQMSGKKSSEIKQKKLEGDGKTGIILGNGKHKTIWNIPKGKLKKLSSITINVDVEEVTDQATYLCLDLKTYTMRCQKDAPDINDITCKTKELWLRRIEPGTFMMGSPESELGRHNNETQHEVTLTKAYYLGVFETTQKQFKTITGWLKADLKNASSPVEYISYNILRGSKKGSQWPLNNDVDEENSGFYEKKRKTFFYLLRSKTGNALLFDLPTEAQWEYACRAGTTTSWNNGTDITNVKKDPELDKLARYWFNGGGLITTNQYRGEDVLTFYGHGTAPVGSYEPNAWGLYDMHGNVYEWCLDWYQTNTSYSVTDPVGANFGQERVVKGGSWFIKWWYRDYGSAYDDVARYCRSANRESGYTYIESMPGEDGEERGFRIALIPPVIEKIQKTFEYELPSVAGKTLPVFETKFYGKDKDGKEYLLEEIGTLEFDGASGIVVGSGKHSLIWSPDDEHADLVDKLELRVESEDVTDQAAYLVLDIPSNKMRASSEDPDLSNDKCRTEELWLKRIEPGTFSMGDPKVDPTSEFPYNVKHEVTLTKAFYIGVFEMTQKQYELLANSTPSLDAGDTRPVEGVSYNVLRGIYKGYFWPKNYQVDELSFFGSLRKKVGNTIDLPTEAQWEYACRAGTTTDWNSGADLTDNKQDPELDKLGRYYYNRNDGKGGYEEHTVVGSYLPNAWGLYDMHGNVDELCVDWFTNFLGSDPVTDPRGPKNNGYNEPVLRGGNYFKDARSCVSFARYDGYARSSSSHTGFRVVIVRE
jgi:formylglycine-generating enzyme required for sulfatase activity